MQEKPKRLSRIDEKENKLETRTNEDPEKSAKAVSYVIIVIIINNNASTYL